MRICLRRREFIAGLGGAAAWPLVASAQQPGLPVIGLLRLGRAGTAPEINAAFLEGLKEGGYIDGRNVAIQYRWAEGHYDRVPALVADLVQRPVKVIVAGGTSAALAAKSATTTIPIVFEAGVDPIRAGLVVRFNRPGGNVTGVTNFTAAIATKRLDLLHQLIPKASSIGILVNATDAAMSTQETDLREAANSLGVQLIVLNASNEQEIDAAFATLVQQRIGALLLTDNAFFYDRREQLVALARFNVVPTMYTFREAAAAGGLLSYASSFTDAMRRTGSYVARILNGEKPGDLPVIQPTKYELVINLKAAKALGLTVPPTLFALADEVIE
jgi:putative ABC transport system substrate-binding protein